MKKNNIFKYCFEVILIGSGIVFGYLGVLSWGDSVIFSILSFLVIESISNSIENQSFSSNAKTCFRTINQKLDDVSGNLALFNTIHKLEENINRIEHPYFKERVRVEIERFIADNIQLFNSKHITSPDSPDTFGRPGLNYTSKDLKCFSSIDDYWDDRRDTDYFSYQKELVIKGVKIKRLFLYSEHNRKKVFEEAKKHKLIGVDVRVIGEKEVRSDLRKRDYLIQDERLLVDLKLDENTKKHLEAREIITTQNVSERIGEFEKFWSAAKKV